MPEEKVVFVMLGIFLIAQVLGLYTGAEYYEVIKTGEVQPVFENPENVENSFWLIAYVLAVTVVVILIIRFWKKLLKVVEASAIFFTSWIVFDFLIPVGIWYLSLGFFLAFLLTAWKMLRPTILSQNIALIFAVAGAGAVIGVSLGVLPVLVFMLFLSIYDFIAVFITKHMVYMAKAITETPTAFTAAVPCKFKKPVFFPAGKKMVKKRIHVFQLGGGDIVIPLTFSVSVLGSYTLKNALFSMFGSAIALGLLIWLVTKKPGHALPALPIVSAGACAGFVISMVL